MIKVSVNQKSQSVHYLTERNTQNPFHFNSIRIRENLRERGDHEEIV